MIKTMFLASDGTPNTKYNQLDFQNFYGCMLSNGVLVPTADNITTTTALKVTASGTTLTISDGTAVIKGLIIKLNSETLDMSALANGTYKIVVEYSAAAGISVKAITTALSQTDTLYQVQLASVVKSGTTLTVTDTRNDITVCGFVNKTVTNNINSIQGVPVANTAPTDGQLFQYEGGVWKPVAYCVQGSNSNGEYYKYADGRLICTKVVSITMTQSWQEGSFWYGTRTSLGDYAMPFIDIPRINCTAISELASAPSCFPDTIKGKTKTSYGTINVYKTATFSNVTFTFDLEAIGHWK